MKHYKCIKSFNVDILNENENVEIEDGFTVEVDSVWFKEENDDCYINSVINEKSYELDIGNKTLNNNFTELSLNETVVAWVFENKIDKGRYLSDGPEFADFEHERGDVLNTVDALMVWMRDGSAVTEEALDEFEGSMKKMKFFNWSKDMRPYYNAVKIEVSQNVIREIEARS